MNDAVMIILVILLCLCFGIAVLGLSENSSLEKEAIRRGYATYDNNGCFVWKEQQK